MPIVRLSYAWIATFVLGLLALALRSDGTVPVPGRQVLYIGGWTEDTDKSYQRFLKVVRAQEPRLAAAVTFQYLSATGGDDQANQRAMQEAVRRRPALIVAPTAEVAALARQLAAPTPVVFATYSDPVAAGLVASLASPGGHMTGVSVNDQLDGKRLEILRDAFPGMRSLGVLVDSWFMQSGAGQLLQDAARRFNLQIAFRQADSVVELPAALADVAAHDAWYIPPTYIAYLAGPQVIELLRRGRRPAIFSNTADVAAGALISYEQDTSFVWSTAANMMARIVLDGESPSGMPIERPRRFELAVRATASSALGPVAPAVVRRADRVF